MIKDAVTLSPDEPLTDISHITFKQGPIVGRSGQGHRQALDRQSSKIPHWIVQKGYWRTAFAVSWGKRISLDTSELTAVYGADVEVKPHSTGCQEPGEFDGCLEN